MSDQAESLFNRRGRLWNKPDVKNLKSEYFALKKTSYKDSSFAHHCCIAQKHKDLNQETDLVHISIGSKAPRDRVSQ